MDGDDLQELFVTKLYTVGSQLTTDFDLIINKVSSSYIKNGEEIDIVLFDGNDQFFTYNNKTLS
jgi:hypothetical protein